MPQWAGSSWYFLRYCDPHNDKALACQGGAGLLDAGGLVQRRHGAHHPASALLAGSGTNSSMTSVWSPRPEPYAKRTSHGMILGENGEKMSKSRGNVVNPDDIVREYGADTLRLYEMFIGDFEKSRPLVQRQHQGLPPVPGAGLGLQEALSPARRIRPELETAVHKTIRKVSEDIEETEVQHRHRGDDGACSTRLPTAGGVTTGGIPDSC